MSATNTTNVNIPQMADTLFERATNASWVVVFKALVTTHHMCVHGNEVCAEPFASSYFVEKNKKQQKQNMISLAEIYPVLGLQDFAVQPQQLYRQNWL